MLFSQTTKPECLNATWDTCSRTVGGKCERKSVFLIFYFSFSTKYRS